MEQIKEKQLKASTSDMKFYVERPDMEVIKVEKEERKYLLF